MKGVKNLYRVILEFAHLLCTGVEWVRNLDGTGEKENA
jgi:hypothetical protein